MPALVLPSDATVRLHIRPGREWPHLVLVSFEADTTPEQLFVPGTVSVQITHHRGMRWPDRRGVLLADVALADRIPVTLAFVDLADALAAKQRLEARR